MKPFFVVLIPTVILLQGVEAQGSYAENQKISAIRNVYQRAVKTPMIGIEQLWNGKLISYVSQSE